MIPNPLTVGLTGGIGSGKTLVASVFATLGARVLSADDVAKHLLDSDNQIRRRLKKEFGEQIYSKQDTLDRKQLGRIVFHDPSALRKLNHIVHPIVVHSLKEDITAFKKSPDKVLFLIEAALIFEAEADSIFDYIIVVDADKDERIRRVIARDNCSKSDVLERMKAQMPAAERIAKADFVIRNMGDQKSLKQQCQFLFTLLQTVARKT